MRASLLILASIGLVATATPQLTKQGAAYLFRAKYTAGQTNRYTMTMSSTMNSQAMLNMETPLVLKTVSVSKGIATVEVATGPAKMNGKSQGQVDKQTVKMDNRNRPQGGQNSFESFGSFAYPEKPIAIGGKWTQKMDMGTAMGGMKLDATYTFVGVKTIGGKQVAEIKSTMKGTMMGPITGSATTYIVMADGSLHSSTVQMVMNINPGQGQPVQKVVTNAKVTRK